MNANNTFKLHFANLTQEILKNTGTQILRLPMMMIRDIMAKVGERCANINDAELNSYMAQLAIYSVCDPQNKDAYDSKIAHETLEGKHGIDAAQIIRQHERLKAIEVAARNILSTNSVANREALRHALK